MPEWEWFTDTPFIYFYYNDRVIRISVGPDGVYQGASNGG